MSRIFHFSCIAFFLQRSSRFKFRTRKARTYVNRGGENVRLVEPMMTTIYDLRVVRVLHVKYYEMSHWHGDHNALFPNIVNVETGRYETRGMSKSKSN